MNSLQRNKTEERKREIDRIKIIDWKTGIQKEKRMRHTKARVRDRDGRRCWKKDLKVEMNRER